MTGNIFAVRNVCIGELSFAEGIPMKKLTMLLCLVLALVSLSALAADADTETSLWPAYDPNTGLWGYIREDGEWGIAPQWERAYHFHGGCAIVDTMDQLLECLQNMDVSN